MAELASLETQDTVVPALYTPPGLANLPGTRVRREDPFLETPERGPDDSGVSASFLLPSTSFDIKVSGAAAYMRQSLTRPRIALYELARRGPGVGG